MKLNRNVQKKKPKNSILVVIIQYIAVTVQIAPKIRQFKAKNDYLHV